MTETDATVRVRLRRLHQALVENGLDAVVCHGVGAVGQYGALTAYTGLMPGNKGDYAVIRAGRAAELIARDDAGASRMRRDSTGAEVVLARAPGRRGAVELMAALLRGSSRIGVAGAPDGFPSTTLSELAEALPTTTICDATAIVTASRRLTSSAEASAMAESTSRAENALLAFEREIRAGTTEREGAAIIEAELVRRGSVLSIVHVSAGRFEAQPPGTRVLADGDVVTAFAETTGADGYWAELGAVFHVGAVAAEDEARSAALIAGLEAAVAASRHGASSDEVSAAAYSTRASRWTPTIGFGHSIGVDEGPPLLDPAPRPLRHGETFALHPSLADAAGARASAVATTVLVGEHSGESLSRFPHRVHRIVV